MTAAALAPLNVWQIATFIALLAAVIGVWIGPRVWWVCLGAATVFGYMAQVVEPIAVLWIAIAYALCWFYARTSRWHWPVWVAIIVVMLALGTHALPGFNNPIVIDRVRFSADAEAFTLYLNFDKTLAGILLLGVCYPNWRGLRDFKAGMQLQNLWWIAALVIILIGASYLLGYVRFDPKFNSLFWIWSAVNVFSVCLSEEAFFRGFLQRELQSAWRRTTYGPWLALGVSASLFGAAHLAGGWKYVLLATLAGMGYGYVYQRTQRIEWSIAAHFALNATHFLLFTYPRVA